MILLWAMLALTIAVVLGILFRPFFGAPPDGVVSRSMINAAIYRDQASRLDRDLQDKLLSEQDHAQAHLELQRRVLDEVRDDDVAMAVQKPKKTMLLLGTVLPVAAVGLYLYLGNPSAVLPLQSQQQVTQQEVEQMVAGLAEKLQKDPSNLKGWAMLARSYKAMGRNAEAEQAFERAGTFIDNDAQLLAVYADLAATNAKGRYAGKPMALIDKALKVDPSNPMAQWLAGSASYQAHDYRKAAQTWEKLSALLAPDSEDARALRVALDDVNAKIAQESGGAAPVAPSAAKVTGVVELDATLKDKAMPGDTVMVIARVPGTRMPVAVLRASVSALPMPFTLDDSLSMSPQARLSMATSVEVEARVSKSGMALPESGDLFSTVQTVKVGSANVLLNIGSIRP